MGDREVDQQLVERAQRGDKRAFELLVIKYQRKLGRLLSRMVRDPAEVEDVAVELRPGRRLGLAQQPTLREHQTRRGHGRGEQQGPERVDQGDPGAKAETAPADHRSIKI